MPCRMDDTRFWSLAAKYLAGEASEQEADVLNAVLVSDPDRRKQFDEAAEAWAREGTQDDVHVDVAAAWKTLENTLGREDAGSMPPSGTARSNRMPRHPDRLAARRRWRFAAGSTVLILAAVAALLFFRERPQEVIATARGERLAVTLSDSTRVQLNAESRLSLVRMGDRGTREVYLEGEAFFEVAHAADRPFLVHTDDGVIRVVGTAFNVQAYAGDEGARVAIAEGAVALLVRSSIRADADSAVVLRPRQLGVLDDHRLRAVVSDVDLAPYLAWREGRLVFDDTPFPEVVRRLERWYDLEISGASLDSVDRLHAVFSREPVDVVIGDIAVALGLDVEFDGNRVTFYRTPP